MGEKANGGIPENMAVWEACGKTDPAHTKKERIRGRTITAIDAYRQIESATALFGPMGVWGLRNVTVIVESEIAILTGEFFYPDGASGASNSFGVTNSIDLFVRPRERPPYRDGEFAKKLMTDTITKALSYLGFNHDVFFGLFDDNRYVEQRRLEAAQGGDDPGDSQQVPEWARGIPPENAGVMQSIWEILNDQVTRNVITSDIADQQWGMAVQARTSLGQLETMKTNLTGRPS